METGFRRLGNYPKYEINKNGVVRVIKTKRELVPQQMVSNGGKEYVRVVHNGVAKNVRIGYLYATAFVKRESSKHNFCVCRDGNWMNLSESNFQWLNAKDGYEDEGKIWKPVKDYENLYVVSEFGDVRSLDTRRILNPFFYRGHKCVSLYKDSVRRFVAVAKIVAYAFLEPSKLKYIRYLDENIENCHFSNLAWTEHYKKKNCAVQTAIIEYSVEGKFIKKWESIKQAADSKGVADKDIYMCCIGKNKTAGGSVWRYKGDKFDKYKTSVPFKLLENEKFVEYKEAPGYEISNRGRMRNLKRGGSIHTISATGYVFFTVDGEHRQKKLGYIIARYFLLNPQGYKYIEFIDGNPTNCDVDNLRWVESKKKEDKE